MSSTNTDSSSKVDREADATDGDALLRALRELPRHAPSPERRIHGAARAAFLREFEDVPFYVKLFGGVGRAVVPVALASVVGLYLFWAFAVAISLNQ